MEVPGKSITQPRETCFRCVMSWSFAKWLPRRPPRRPRAASRRG
jgi:hypothetical protein